MTINSWLPTFLVDHPVISFFLAWPLVILLVANAALVVSLIEAMINMVVQLVTLFVNAFVLLCRGYAPQSVEAQPEPEEPAQ